MCGKGGRRNPLEEGWFYNFLRYGSQSRSSSLKPGSIGGSRQVTKAALDLLKLLTHQGSDLGRVSQCSLRGLES